MQVVLILLAVIIGVPIPLSPLSILYINLALNGLNGIALSVENGEAELMLVPPRRRDESLLEGSRLGMFLMHTILLQLVMLLNYLLGLWWFTGHIRSAELDLSHHSHSGDGAGFNHCQDYTDLNHWNDLSDEKCRDGIERAKTMLFLTLVFTELVRGYTVRNYLRPIWSGIFENRMMAIATLISLGLALVFVLVDTVNDVFDLTNTLPYFGWLMALAAAIFVAICDELLKYRIRSVTHAHSPVEPAS